MSDHLAAVAETTKLARVLGISDPIELDFLVDLPPAAIREYRERVTDRLFDRDTKRLRGIAAASKIVPVALSSKMAERAFGPVLCAAVASAVEPHRAVDIAKHLNATFLAECAVQLDPRRTADIIAAVPAKMVTDVARELLSRGDHITMGRFVHVVPEPALRAAAPVMSDPDLLRIGFLLEDKTAIDRVLHIVADRVAGVIRSAYDQNMWAEGIDLLDSIAPHNRAWIGDITAGLGGEVLDALINAVAALDAWATLLPITSAMSHDSLRLFAERPAVHGETTLAAIMDAALDGGQWVNLLPLASLLPPAQLAFIAARVGDQNDDRLGELIRDAHAADLWAAMIPVALALTDDNRRRFAGLPIMTEPEVLTAIITATADHDLWSQALPLVDALPEDTKPTLAALIGDLTREQLLAAVLTASRGDNIHTLVDIALAQDQPGRARILQLIDGMDDIEEFLSALTTDTPDVVWQALIQVHDEIPARLLAQLAERARELGRDDDANKLEPVPATTQ
ncbi:hypothetical protein [Nocardia seriolae]|uniref:Uncharacterized protein n=1 Tax=Nocardia seriolae TaxID=37332 RepID=A0ABC9YV10_9NOCA|nr:hypothetical protein [Nocardia seriolae]BEK95685.1 hypothetical protein NSER024013_35910 [Nocardia seriolae]GAM47475.1 hypothetical protein NS07_v2contig00051-0007 [Nocardia seriolae]GAP29337.1 hypothetical protein NSK11_contig00054-0007 [Nocardia seriolae]